MRAHHDVPPQGIGWNDILRTLLTRISNRDNLVLMANLNERKTKILKAVIDEYIETAQPVGSGTLERKFNMNVSPATIRNEMVELTNLGFLKKVHSSSGRMPTPMALKYYVANLMREQQMSLSDEVAVKEKVWDYRHKMDKMLREVTHELANRTKELAIATTDEGDIYSSGTSHILESPEFYDIDLTRALLSQIDEVAFWNRLTNRSVSDMDAVDLLLGNDFGSDIFEPCSFVFARFTAGKHKGAIGVLGPARLNFGKVFPTIRYFRGLLDEVFKGW